MRRIKEKLMRYRISPFIVLFLGMSFLWSSPGWADDKDVLIQKLTDRLAQLEQKVNSLEQKTAAAVASASPAAAASAPPMITMPTIHGFIDTTYNYNFHKVASGTTVLGNPNTSTAGPNNVSAFVTKANNITFNNAQILLTGAVKDTNYVIKLDAGTDAMVIHPTSGVPGGGAVTGEVDVQEAYFTTPLFNSGVTLKLGKFVTLNGIEVIESMNDPTISRGYLFGMAEPYTNTGFLLSKPLPSFLSGLTLQAGVVNGWDTLVGNNPGETFLGGLGINYGDIATGELSVYIGPAQTGSSSHNRSTVDLTIANKPLPKLLPALTLNLQGNYGQEGKIGGVRGRVDHWYGFGVQPVYQFTDKFSLGGRIEFMENKNGSRFGTNVGGKLTNFTITPSYKLNDSVTARMEYRHDMGDKSFFAGKDGVFDQKTMDQVMAEFIYSF